MLVPHQAPSIWDQGPFPALDFSEEATGEEPTRSRLIQLMPLVLMNIGREHGRGLHPTLFNLGP